MNLRQALMALSDEQQRLLVQVAMHALDDVEFSEDIADLTGVDHTFLIGEERFAIKVVGPLFDAAQAEAASAKN